MILSAFSVAVVGLAIYEATKNIDIRPFNCQLCIVFHVAWIVFIVSLFIPYTLELVQFVGIAVFTRQLLWKIWPTMF